MRLRTLLLCVAVLAAQFQAGSALAQKLTYEQAKQRLQPRELPKFWVSAVDDLPQRWAGLSSGTVREIAKSPGGRPLHVVAYGEREPVARRANFNSAVGGQDPSAYLDRAARRKPVVYFVGPVHGHEVEGLTGLVNLIAILESGRDLRGKEQPVLRDLARQCRVVIVPCGNPDGAARFEPRAIHGMPHDEFQFWGQGTWKDDSIAFWPGSKRQHPFTGPEIGWMGCYFNDKGINPMHDEFLAPMSTEAPAILRVAMEEGPDLAVSLHSHEASPAVLRPAWVPLETQQQVRKLAEQTYALFDARKLPHGGLPAAQPEDAKGSASFNLVSALYHISGTTPFTFECPHGVADPKACQVSLEQILDIQLSLYEAMLRFAIDQKPGGSKR